MFSGVYLHHLRDVKRIHPSKRVGGDQDDSAVCIDLLLGVTQLYGLEHLKSISGYRIQRSN